MNIAILGYGYWGPNLARNFFNLNNNCKLKLIVDHNPQRLELARKQYPNIAVALNIDDAINSTDIDCIVIALPISLHYPIAKEALLKGKNVLVEKPMTQSVEQAEELIELAIKKNTVLMVDHTFLYTGSIRKIKELIDSDELGEIQYFDSVRINLGIFQYDSNVIWDLASHDISILEYLFNESPEKIQTIAISHTKNKIENMAYLSLFYKTNKFAHINVSWSSPVKVRRIIIGGSKKMILFDDIEPTEKIKVYDTGYSIKSIDDKSKVLIDYRTSDIFIPKIDNTEALKLMCEDFINAVNNNKKPISDYSLGLKVIKTLESAEKSIVKY